jgi:hypothetical protein
MFAFPQSSGKQRAVLFTAMLAGLGAVAAFAQEPASRSPVRVSIKDEKPLEQPVAVAGHAGPIDPTPHIMIQSQGNMMVNLRVDNQTIQLGFIQTLFQIDGRFVYPATAQGRPLPKKKDGTPRSGIMSVFTLDKLTITQEIEVVPTKARKPGEKRRLDSAMITYFVDNKDTRSHKVGMRIFMDVYIVNNDGALFAAPTQPGKILDGVELKGKLLPDYLQFLQQPDLKNPGFVAHMTLNFGKTFEMPDRIVLTSLGAQRGQWDVGVQQAGGDSAMAVFWEPKEVKAGVKKKLAYAFGQGIAPSPQGDGNVAIALGGSFEPGKLFTVTAHVLDPAPGQSLILELPAGMERVEGKERQPVPVAEDANSMVLWKARVLRPGQFNLRVHSSTGVTQTKIVTITENK